MNTKKTQQELQDILVWGCANGKFSSGIHRDMAEDICYEVQMKCNGLAKDIASSVLKYGNCSSKQAYILAKAVIDNNIDLNF